MEILNDHWLQIGCKQMDLFEQDNVAYMSCLVNGTSLMQIWKMVYARSVKLKQLTPIEKVPQDVKERLWKEANELCSERMNKEQLIDLSKVLLTIYCFAGKL